LGNFLLDYKKQSVFDGRTPSRIRTDFGTPLFTAPEKLQALNIFSESIFEIEKFDELKADIWSLGMLIWRILTFSYPFEKDSIDSLMSYMGHEVREIPVLPNTGDYAKPFYSACKEIVAGCLTVDPAKRFTAKQVQAKLLALIKTVKPPPPSQIFTAADFDFFFNYVAQKLKKPEEKLFAEVKSLLKMLGSIPLELEKKIDFKSLPTSEVSEDGETTYYQGIIDSDNRLEGLGCYYNKNRFFFGARLSESYAGIMLDLEENMITFTCY